MKRNRLNVPSMKIRKNPIIWITEAEESKQWRCHQCSNKVITAFQFFFKKEVEENDKIIDKAIPVYLCATCAKNKLEMAIDDVKVIENIGAQGFMFQREL